MKLISQEPAPSATVRLVKIAPLQTQDQSVDEAVILRIRDALNEMKFGQVTISIKDGEVVQVDRMQRTRLFRRRNR